MYSQQFHIIANIFMAFDAIVIGSTGYVTYLISHELGDGYPGMAWNDFIGILLFLIVANNYLMGRFGFYSDRRFHSTGSMVRNLSLAVFLSFILLATGGLMLGREPFSRIYLVLHFTTAMVILIVEKTALYFYLDRRARTAFNSRNILITGTGERIASVIAALQLQRSWGHTIAGWITVDNREFPDIRGIPNLGGWVSLTGSCVNTISTRLFSTCQGTAALISGNI